MIELYTDFSQIDEMFRSALVAKDKALRTVTINAIAIISERIQNQGKATNGNAINGGDYSKGYKKKRSASGRRTSIVDLTFTGDMMDRGFRNQQVSNNEWAIGLAGSKTSAAGRKISHGDLMAHFEKTNGPIITPSEEEAALLNKVLLSTIEASLT